MKDIIAFLEEQDEEEELVLQAQEEQLAQQGEQGQQATSAPRGIVVSSHDAYPTSTGISINVIFIFLHYSYIEIVCAEHVLHKYLSNYINLI